MGAEIISSSMNTTTVLWPEATEEIVATNSTHMHWVSKVHEMLATDPPPVHGTTEGTKARSPRGGLSSRNATAEGATGLVVPRRRIGAGSTMRLANS